MEVELEWDIKMQEYEAEVSQSDSAGLAVVAHYEPHNCVAFLGQSMIYWLYMDLQSMMTAVS